MIVNRSALMFSSITAIDKKIPILNNIHITAEGAIVASNGKVLSIVEPITPESRKNALKLFKMRGSNNEVIGTNEKNKNGVTISCDTIKEVLKSLPKDTTFKGLLENVSIDKYFLLMELLK